MPSRHSSTDSQKSKQTHGQGEGGARHTLDTLRKLRDEVKLHMHLASMEAKSRFGSLEAELAEIDQGAHATKDGVEHLVQRLAGGFQSLYDSLRSNH